MTIDTKGRKPERGAARGLAVLVLLAALSGAHAAENRIATRVLSARADDGAEAWSSARDGLVVERWRVREPTGATARTTLRLGRAAFPRFAADGRLVFERSRDDGHRVLERSVRIVDPGTRNERAPRAGEAWPAWQPPARAGSGPTRVCVDPGHGGSDPGGIGNGLLEKDVNLDVGLRLAAWFADDTADVAGGASWEVLLTRATDVDVTLLERVTMANAFGAQSFVSLHCNAFADPQANGTETYAFSESSGGAPLRDLVHARMIAAWGLTDRGTKTANFYVLANTVMPASLSEMAFITNPGDALLLGDAAAREEMALAHLLAVQEFHGFTPYEPGAGSGSDGTLKGVLYDATVGPAAPIAGGTVALADGRFVVTSATGFFEFPLAAGSYAFAATAPGYAAAAASERVTSGDVWESVGLLPVVAPELLAAATGSALDLDLAADAFAPALLAAALAPGVPPPALGGKGTLWPDASTLLTIPLGTLGADGTLHVDATLPAAPGFALHLQVLTSAGGVLRLSNGAAVAFPR